MYFRSSDQYSRAMPVVVWKFVAGADSSNLNSVAYYLLFDATLNGLRYPRMSQKSEDLDYTAAEAWILEINP
jgi:hypothetical protein